FTMLTEFNSKEDRCERNINLTATKESVNIRKPQRRFAPRGGQHGSDQVATFNRNTRPDSFGLSGQIHRDSQ
ncbi:MAG: hypothetical protein ABSB22_15130, partial [Thermodesulfobacteriota bacterium]